MRWMLGAAVLILIVPAYLRAFSMSGRSEVPTILPHDVLIVNKAAYSLKLPYTEVKILRTGSPARDDMVQLRFPIRELVGFKRVMGLPRETIEIRNSHVLVNGQPIPIKPLDPENFFWVPKENKLGTFVGVEQDHFITYTPGTGRMRDFPPVRLAAQQYFLLGDNRDDSWDSRDFGPVSTNRIFGKVIAVFPRRSAPATGRE